MPDNWEFALGKATGEYVTCLTDDSYLLPDAIRIAVAEIERSRLDMVVWRHCAYFANDWWEPGRRNLLYMPKVSGTATTVDSRFLLTQLYAKPERVSTMIPKFLNCLCHRSVIERIIAAQGRVFIPPCPDYTFAAAALIHVPAHLLLDVPLYIDGVTPSSIGATASFNLGESAQNFIREFADGLEAVGFLGIPTSSSSIYKSLEAVRRLYPRECPEPNVTAMLCSVVDHLVKVRSNGASTDEYWRKLERWVQDLPLSVRLAVVKQRILSLVKWRAINEIRARNWLVGLERLRGLKVLRGEKCGFYSIQTCAAVVAKCYNKELALGGSQPAQCNASAPV